MKKGALLLFGIVLVVAFIAFSIFRAKAPQLKEITGLTMGNIVYNVKFLNKKDLVSEQEIDSLLVAFNQSLSTYIPNSEISELNRTGYLTFRSSYFLPVLQTSLAVFQKTKGTFDPTMGVLTRAWGFGPDHPLLHLDSVEVDSLLRMVGFDKVVFNEREVSMPAFYQIDFGAIAKGYAVDLVGELLESRGVENYLVEIGGEVRCRGVNADKKSWALGIENPTVTKEEDQKLLAIVRLRDLSLATSGNYRNYYEKEGIIYAHIIDPRTGYSVKHNLLSASVFASDCMTADAFATAFMVLGLEASKELVESENIEAFLVYLDDEGKLKSYASKGIKPYLELNKAK